MVTRIFFIIVAIIFMTTVLSKVKKKKFFERESFLWFLGSVLALVLAIFPNLIKIIARLTGIEYAPSVLFFGAIVFLLYLVFRQSEQVSLLKEQTKDLGQRLVVMEKLLKESNNQKEEKIDE